MEGSAVGEDAADAESSTSAIGWKQALHRHCLARFSRVSLSLLQKRAQGAHTIFLWRKKHTFSAPRRR
jgi:hypothetical protein